jgi:hypothetical protein
MKRARRVSRRARWTGNDAGWAMNPALFSGRLDGREVGPSMWVVNRAGLATIVAFSSFTAPISASGFDRIPGNVPGTARGDAILTRNVPFRARRARPEAIASGPITRTARLSVSTSRFTARRVRLTGNKARFTANKARLQAITGALPGRTSGPVPHLGRRPGCEALYPRAKRVFPASGRTRRTRQVTCED